MRVDTRQLRNIQQKLATQASTEDTVHEIKKIAGFDCAFFGDKIICAAVVIDAQTFKVLEQKTIMDRIPMPYVPGYLAFREGPMILRSYYDLEEEPDVLMVDGHGIAHPRGAGLAVYVGVELDKPTLGVAKSLLVGDVKDDVIVFEDKPVGKIVQTKEHARPVYVSPGSMISVDTAAKLVQSTTKPPHKLPEALHLAHRLAKKTVQRLSMPLPNGQETRIAAEA